MAKKEKEPLSYLLKLKRIKDAGLADSPTPNRLPNKLDDLPTIEERISMIMGIINKPTRPACNMLFFVMYDIESNKVRTQIVKYLLRKGCTRIQRSIFLADLSSTAFEEIKRDLAEVQSLYNNHDSILVVPISSDYLQAMRVIGQSIEIDIITHAKNTLFF